MEAGERGGAAAPDQGPASIASLPWRDSDIGVVIIDHGSRREESNELLNAFVTLYRAQTGRGIVEPAHMEIAEPTIAHAFDACVSRGAKMVVVSPYFLSPGRHWYRDIPDLAAAAAAKHPGVPYVVTAPIGVHKLVAQVVEDRIQHCLSRVAGDAAECEACAGARGCQLLNQGGGAVSETPLGGDRAEVLL